MNNRMLAVLGALAAVAVIILYVFVKHAGSAPDTGSTPQPSTQNTGPSTGPITTANGGITPALPATGSDPGSGDNPKDYMVGDIHVRDHRTGNHEPLDLPPNVHPPQQRELPSTLTHEISQQVRQLLGQCAIDVAKDARGAKPRLDGQLTVSIKDHTLTLTNIATQVRDVDGPSADALKQCVEQKSVGLTAVARDQADITDYGIAITFAIP